MLITACIHINEYFVVYRYEREKERDR